MSWNHLYKYDQHYALYYNMLFPNTSTLCFIVTAHKDGEVNKYKRYDILYIYDINLIWDVNGEQKCRFGVKTEV